MFFVLLLVSSHSVNFVHQKHRNASLEKHNFCTIFARRFWIRWPKGQIVLRRVFEFCCKLNINFRTTKMNWKLYLTLNKNHDVLLINISKYQKVVFLSPLYRHRYQRKKSISDWYATSFYLKSFFQVDTLRKTVSQLR